MSHAFHAQKRKEKFYKLAKERGYRSRAAFKLIQLNKKYNFLAGARACVDLCAAPGGWLQICAENMPVGSLIIGVDLLPIRPIPGVITFVDDILTQSCRQKIRKQLNQWQVDLVLHDGAPNVGGGGTWTRDAYQQCELVLHSLKLATEFLVEGGTFVTKIFRSQDFIALCWVLRQFFKKVDVTKPTASRMASAEIFAVCQGYLAPKRIDPRMFDPAVVFKQAPTQVKTPNVLAPVKLGGKIKANREGYETDKQIIFERVPLSEFFAAENPSTVLARANELYFDQDSEEFRTSPLTKPEILHLIQDIKVLGRSDFTLLVRWHKKVRDFRKAERRRQEELLAEEARRHVLGDAAETEEEEEADKRVLTEEERDQALLELKEIEDLRRRNERKKRLELRQKQLRRLARNINNQDLNVDAADEGLFSMGDAHDQADLGELGEDLTEEQLDKFLATGGVSSDEEEDDNDATQIIDRSTYLKLTEESLTRYYAEYNKMRRNVIQDKSTLGLADEANRAQGLAPVNLHAEDEGDAKSGEGEDEEDDDTDYIASLQQRAMTATSRTTGISGLRDSEDVTASRWFGQDAFEDIDLEVEQPNKATRKTSASASKAKATPEIGSKRKQSSVVLESDEDEDSEGDEEDADEYEYDDEDDDADEDGDDDEDEDDEDERKSSKNDKRFQRTYDEDSEDESDDDDASDSEFAAKRWDAVDAHGVSAATSKQARQMLKAKAAEDKKKKKKGEEDETPEKNELSDISEDEQAQAEILAIGTKMIRRKDRNAIVDAAYNRYAWNDQSDLPGWFVEDENQFNRAQLPVTKAEVNAVMQHLKAVNARPIKKLAEAKARKKMKMMRKLDRMKIQANAIVNQDNVSAEEKMKAIDKLYRMTRAKQKLKPQRTYIVSAKGGGGTEVKSKTKGSGKAFVVRVDTRMKKDKRAEQRSKRRVEKARKLRNKKRVKKNSDTF